MSSRLIVIAGPTASGKTALSIELAQAFNAEIFSADARQFYRGMDIGTAKPTPDEQRAVKHHFIDTLEPTEEYSAGQYAEDLEGALKSYFKQRETAIVVGGSGFYIKAALEGLDDLPRVDRTTREVFNALYEREGLTGLQQQLQKLDPAYFSIVDQNNRQRLQRALEAIKVSGETFSSLRKGAQRKLPWTIKSFELQWPREILYERINARVDQMMDAGLLNEVKQLYPLKRCNALQTVGYKELFDYMDGIIALDAAVNKIKQHSRNYAKRQRTWFRKQAIDHRINAPTIKSVIRHL